MKTQQELCDILGFIAEYATYQLGSGVHTSRVIRNAQRIGEALGVDVQLSSFQKSTILTVLDTVSGESATRVVAIPSLPISFERNSDLSALSWDALDEGLSLRSAAVTGRWLTNRAWTQSSRSWSSGWPTPHSASSSAATGRPWASSSRRHSWASPSNSACRPTLSITSSSSPARLSSPRSAPRQPCGSTARPR